MQARPPRWAASGGREAHGAVVEFERLSEPPPPPIPDEYVLRPLYARGREVWVSADDAHLHSTPEATSQATTTYEGQIA